MNKINNKFEEYFNMTHYDGIGFDLDNTLIRYNKNELLNLQYQILAQFLVEEKGYSSKYLPSIIGDDHGIISKGLVLDLLKGNILQINSTGRILQATHGTHFLSDDQIIQIYNPERQVEFCQEFFSESFKSPLPSHYRLLVDIYDNPAALVYARAVNSIDNSSEIHDETKNNSAKKYLKVWQDIIAGFYHMFEHAHVRLNKGGYYSTIMQNPEKYLKKSSVELLNWLEQIKLRNCKIFLLTGSPADFATKIANYVFGMDWKKYFDIMIVNAKKPRFFFEKYPFLKVDNLIESDKTVSIEELCHSEFYSQGNWTDLKKWLNIGRCVYFGDNLFQDIRAPPLVGIDSIAVVEELENIYHNKCIIQNKDQESNFWTKLHLMSNELIYPNLVQTYSKLCIPNIDILTNLALDTNIKCFTATNNQIGYFPNFQH